MSYYPYPYQYSSRYDTKNGIEFNNHSYSALRLSLEHTSSISSTDSTDTIIEESCIHENDQEMKIKNNNSTILIVLDFDDTLCPKKTNSNTNIDELSNLGRKVFKFLNSLISKYNESSIKIITSSQKGWINYHLNDCCNICNSSGYIDNEWNAVNHLLSKIEIFHPSRYEICSFKISSYAPYQSKCAAFNKLLSKYPSIKYITSIGDGMDEYDASKYCVSSISSSSSNIKSPILHRIKLISKPSIKNMIEEMSLLISLVDENAFTQTNVMDFDYESVKQEETK